MQYLGQSMASVLYRSTHCIISLLASVYAFHTSSRRVKSLLSYIAVVPWLRVIGMESLTMHQTFQYQAVLMYSLCCALGLNEKYGSR